MQNFLQKHVLSRILDMLSSIVVYMQGLQAAVGHAASMGVLFVASAGNNGEDTDTVEHFPSGLPDDIVLAVAAGDRSNNNLW